MRPSRDPRQTPIERTKTTRAASTRPRDPNPENERAASVPGSIAPVSRSSARPAARASTSVTTTAGSTRVTNHRTRDGASDHASRLVPRSSSRATSGAPTSAPRRNGTATSSPWIIGTSDSW